MKIRTKQLDGTWRTLQVWVDDGEIYIRESMDRGRDVQTVCATRSELEKILAAEKDGKL